MAHENIYMYECKATGLVGALIFAPQNNMVCHFSSSRLECPKVIELILHSCGPSGAS